MTSTATAIHGTDFTDCDCHWAPQNDRERHAGPESFSLGGEFFYFYREEFPFGRFPAYRSDSGRIRFYDPSTTKFFSGSELADELAANYYQVREPAIRMAEHRYPELRALPA